MSKVGKYIYGIINSNVEEFFKLGGIGTLEDSYRLGRPTSLVSVSARHVMKAMPLTDEPSLDGKDIAFFSRAHTISFRDISAVVSDAEVADYSGLPKDTLARLLLRHQEVIEKIMSEHTIIPMRFGTFAESEQETIQILSRGYKTIKDIFERAKNTIEIDVAATLNDFNSFIQEVSEQDEIKQLKQSLLSKKGGVTLDDQIQVGVFVKKHLDKKREEYAEQIQKALSMLAQDLKGHDLMDDKMIINMAFLIEQNRQKDFEQEVDRLNNEFEEKLNFRCVGPLPPYSFYTLEIKRARFEEINWAREKLGLANDFITASDIKKAHRKVALTCHPDKKPDEPGIEKKFDDMTRAYKILLDYYRSSNQTEQTSGCYFNEEAFENSAMLVTTAE
jgi:hypothetical protein